MNMKTEEHKNIFELLPMKSVIYGAGMLEELPSLLIKNNIKRPFIITGRTLAKKTNLVNRIKNIIGPSLVGVFFETLPHSPRSLALTIAEEIRKTNADGIISFGGGSVVDTAKSVVMVLAENMKDVDSFNKYRCIFNYDSGKLTIPSLTGETIPHIAITTTLSAGEFTHIAGLLDEKRKVKDMYMDHKMTPTSVILDPELTLATPNHLWFSTGIKAIEHAVEIISSKDNTLFTDALGLMALKTLFAYLPVCYKEPDNIEARGYCQVGAWLSIFGVNNVRLGLSAALGHQLGAKSSVPHGYTSCVVLPATMEYNRPAVLAKQVQMAEAIGVKEPSDTDERAAERATEALRGLIKGLMLPWRIRDVGVKRIDFEGIAKEVMEDMIVSTNPRKIKGYDEIASVLEKAW